MTTQNSSTSVLDKSLIPLRLPRSNPPSQAEIEVGISVCLYNITKTQDEYIAQYLEGQLKILFWLLYDVTHYQALALAQQAIREAKANV